MTKKATPLTFVSGLSFVAFSLPSFSVSVWLSETGWIWAAKTTSKVTWRRSSCTAFLSLHTDSLICFLKSWELCQEVCEGIFKKKATRDNHWENVQSKYMFGGLAESIEQFLLIAQITQSYSGNYTALEYYKIACFSTGK